jgi:hypothetical protein
LFYEYARESRAVRVEVAGQKERNAKNQGKPGEIKFGQRVQNNIQTYFLYSLVLADGFPNTPWQSLSGKDKLNILKSISVIPQLARYFATSNNPPITFALNEPETMTLDMWKKQCRERLPTIPASDPIKSGFFAVNMKYGYDVLIDEFKKWLRHFEGKPMIEYVTVLEKKAKSKPRGRQSFHDELNALGAMRLRYFCNTFSEAQMKMNSLKGKPSGMFYGQRYSFNRACAAAGSHFTKLYGWLDLEKPIHFTKGWGTQK